MKNKTKIAENYLKIKYALVFLLSALHIIGLLIQKVSAEVIKTDFQLTVEFETKGVVNKGKVVVALVPEMRVSGTPLRSEIVQSEGQFQPFVSIAQSNAIAEFSNKDEFEHHVYSFSKSLSFELPLYRGDKTQELKLASTGIVPIGCNIHDWMLGYIVIVDTPYFTFANDQIAVFEKIPVGKYQVLVWHPSMEDFWSSSLIISSAVGAQTVRLPFSLEPVAPFPTPTLEEIELEEY